MAADSDGDLIETVLTCEGDLKDPAFAQKFDKIVTRLRKLVCTGEGESLRVAKVEPWNSVRVTFTIPREAALRLRQMAQEGDAALTALGILSVQVEGDQVISLRIAGPCGTEPREIVLRTASSSSAGPDNAVASTSSAPDPPPMPAIAAPPPPAAAAAGGHPPQFRSPNVVAPTDGDPIPPIPPAASPGTVPAASATPGAAGAGPFPFASMTHAAHAMRERPAVSGSPTYRAMQGYPTSASSSSPAPPPPPYPSSPASTSGPAPPSLAYPSKPAGGRPDVALSSPLLVNLLQNDASGAGGSAAGAKMPPPPPGAPEKPVRARPANKKAVVRRRPDGTVLSESPGKVASAFANVPQSEEALSRLSPSTGFPTAPDQLPVSFGPRQVPSGPRHPPPPSAQAAAAAPSRQYPGPGPQPPPYANRLPNQQQMLLQQQQLQQQRLLQQRMLQHQQQQQQQQQMTMPEAKPYAMAPAAPPPTNATPSPDFPRYPANGNGTTSSWARGPAPFVTAPPPSPAPSYAAPTPTATSEPPKTASPPPLTSAGKRRQLLINPLTGHLEPMASESSSDSEPEPAAAAPEAGTPDDPFFYFPSPLNDRSNSMFSDDDDDVSSTLSRRADTTTTTDQSDSEATVRSTASEASSSRGHHRKRDRSPAAGGAGAEKIKLRLKLDKGEPTPAAYKVDVSFPAARKGASARPEEPRVPPLHISLRGRAAVVVSSRKKYVPPKDGPGSPAAPKKRAIAQGPDGQPIKTSKGSKLDSKNSTPRPRKPGSASGKTKSGEPRIDGKPRVKPKPDVAKEPLPPNPAGPVEENAVKEERKTSPNKTKRREGRKRTADGPAREQNLLSGGRMLDGQFRGSGRGGHSKGGGHANARRREVARRGSEGEVKVEENGVGGADKRRRQSCPDDKDLSFTDTQGVPSTASKPTPTPPPNAVVPATGGTTTPRVHNAHAKPGGKSKHPSTGAASKPHRDDNCVKRNDSAPHDSKRNCTVDVDPPKKVSSEDVVKVSDVSSKRVLDVLDAISKQRLETIEACKQRLMAASEKQRPEGEHVKQRHMEVAEINALGLDVTVTEVTPKGRACDDAAKKRLADAAASNAKQSIEITEVNAKRPAPDAAEVKPKATELRLAEVAESSAKQRLMEIAEANAKQRLMETSETNAKQRLLDVVEATAKQRMLEAAETNPKRTLEISEVNSKKRLLDVAEAKQRLLDVSETKQRLMEVAETKHRLLEVVETKQRLMDVVETKQRLMDVVETKQRLMDVSETKQRLLDVAETKQRLLDVAETKQRLLDVTESKQRLLEAAETKRLLDVAETKQRLAAVEEANAKQRLLESSESKRLVEEAALKQRQSPEGKEPNGEAGNTQGEDSGIESMDALSEKSPNQGESPGRKEDTPPAIAPPVVAVAAKPERREENESKPASAEPCRAEPAPSKPEPDDITPVAEAPATADDDDRDCDSPPLVVNRSAKAKPLPASPSPSPDDPQPIRITPPLYTYSNPEKHRDETPSPGVLLLDDEEDGRAARRKEEMRRKRKRKQELEGRAEPSEDGEDGTRFLDALADKSVSKSLLEQLLIEIPADEGKRGRSTRSSSLKTPRSSPLVRDDNGSKLSPLVRSKRKRQESESSAASSLAPDCADTVPPTATGANAVPRPGKRKCSENAAELIKACMGLDESPAKKPAAGAPAAVVAPATPQATGGANAVVDGRKVAGKARKAGACATLADPDSSEDDEPLIDLKSRPAAAAPEDTTPRHRTPRVSVPTAKVAAAALGKESTPRRSGRQAPRTPLATPKTRAKPALPPTPALTVAQVAAAAIVVPQSPAVATVGDEESNRRKTRSAGPSVETEGVNKSTRRRPSRDGK